MFRVKAKIDFSSSALAGIFCVFILSLFNYTFWVKALDIYSPISAHCPFLIAFAILLATILFTVLTLLNFKYILKPFLIFLSLVGALSAYAMDTYGYVISTQAFQNIVETDTHEVNDLLSLKLSIYLLLLFVLPTILILKIKLKYPTIKTQLVYLFVSLLLVAGNIILFNKTYASFLRNHKPIRYYLNPFRPVYSMAKYGLQHFKETRDETFQILDSAPTKLAQNGKPRLVILVVGESDRAINHGINGYVRQTTPRLALRHDVVSFSQFYSCGTETSVSVPCMFSAFKRSDFTYGKGRYTENVLDLLQKSEVQVLWRDNDSGCKNVCDRVQVDDFNNASIAEFCNGSECHDEILLYQLQDYIDSALGDKLIVLHKKGNHGPAYHKRYPQQFEKFVPTCQSNELQDCTDQQIVNTYDNIILYTDYFLDKVIDQLEKNNIKYQTAMIYVSDHGESLGEHGVYLHAMPYILAPKEQIHVPFIFWASPDFSLDRARLSQLQHKELSHDNLFHSLLGMFGVNSTVYEQHLDLFANNT